MLFSYNWLQEHSKEKLPKQEKLAELLNMHSFEVENFEKLKTDWIFDIKVLPNRAHDCLCHLGIAREIAAIQRRKLQTAETKTIKARKGALKSLRVRVQSPQLVPRYTALVVEGVTVAESPRWLKERLVAVGVNSINNVVDLTNFVMLELGQPLHAFDFDSIQEHQIIVREAHDGERIETLDDKILSLEKGMLVIQDGNRLIDLAGIKGGKASSISNDTHHIVLQAANFNAGSIYRTKVKLNYSSRAADIYAHDIDPNLTMKALERASKLLPELGINGNIVQVIDIYPKKIKPRHIPLRMEFVSSLLGVSVSPKEVKEILGALGCAIQVKKNQMLVTVPTQRLDLTVPEDLVEEIGRMHEYESIPTNFPVFPLIPAKKNAELLWRENIQDIFKAIGFCEVYTSSLIGEKDFSKFLYSKEDREHLVALKNPLSEDLSHLRNSLIENLLKTVRDNEKKISNIRIFEMGTVFRQDNGNPQETSMLCAAIWNSGFYEIKGISDFLLQGLGIANVWYDEYKQTPEKSRVILWNKEKSAEIKVDSTEIGFLGEISDSLRLALKISKPVCALQVNLHKLIRLASEEKEYRAPSRFPAVIRDIAIVVPLHTQVAKVLNVLENAGGKLVEDIDLFDMYEGKNLGEGKKNLAFHIIYQAKDRTLTNKEVELLHNRVIKAIEENAEWEVRK